MTDRLDLNIDKRWLWKCYPLLQKGVRVPIPAGCRLHDLLTGPLALDNAYITDRLQTILIDGRPVDDVDTATVSHKADVSLSGALPGLAGATLRKGGYYAGLRQSISFDCTLADPSGHPGWVRVKLFNIVLRELGPGMLSRGIEVEAKDAVDLVNACRTEDPAMVGEVLLNREQVNWDSLGERAMATDSLVLWVTESSESHLTACNSRENTQPIP